MLFYSAASLECQATSIRNETPLFHFIHAQATTTHFYCFGLDPNEEGPLIYHPKPRYSGNGPTTVV